MSKLRRILFSNFHGLLRIFEHKYWYAIKYDFLSAFCVFFTTKARNHLPPFFFWGSYSICHAGKPIKKSTLIYIRVHHVFLGSRFYWWDHIGNCRGFFAHVAQTLIAFHYISPLPRYSTRDHWFRPYVYYRLISD